jgi:hypothetical protein
MASNLRRGCLNLLQELLERFIVPYPHPHRQDVLKESTCRGDLRVLSVSDLCTEHHFLLVTPAR